VRTGALLERSIRVLFSKWWLEPKPFPKHRQASQPHPLEDPRSSLKQGSVIDGCFTPERGNVMKNDEANPQATCDSRQFHSSFVLIASIVVSVLVGCAAPMSSEREEAPDDDRAAAATPGAQVLEADPMPPFPPEISEKWNIDPGQDPGVGPDVQPRLESGAKPPVDAIEAPMRVDCTTLEGAAADYAIKNQICPDPKHPQPNDTRWGNCGSSWIYVWNRGHGNAYVWWGFASIQGTVVRRNLTASWFNYDRNTGGRFIDSNYMLSTLYSNDRVFTTAAGSVLVWLSGNVRLVWGGTCVILYPTDAERITW